MRILFLQDLQQIIPLSRTTIWRLEGQGRFPRRVRIAGRVGWMEDEIRSWLAAQPRGKAQ